MGQYLTLSTRNTKQVEHRKASDYSNYEFNLGFSTPKKTNTTIPDNNKSKPLDIPTIPLSKTKTLNNDEILYTLRHFHLGDPSTIDKTETVSDDYVPALLHTYRDASKIRYNYPLFLDTNGEAKPISTLLRDSVDDNARILKDNLSRIENYLRKTLKKTEGPSLANPLLTEAGKAVQAELSLDEENNASFEADFNKLLASIKPNAQILGYGQYAAIHLLNHAIRHTLIPRRAKFNETLKQHIKSLKTLLDINWRHTDESIEPRMALNSIGSYASSHFDPLALSDIMDHSRGSVCLTKERHQRIETVLQILEDYLQHDDPIQVKCVNKGGLSGDWVTNTPYFEEINDPNPCARATGIFDQQTALYAEVFSAARIAYLEINNIYDPAIHDPWFDHFTWEAFSKEEMLLLPVVIALESAERVAGSAMNALSRLLSSGRPVQVLVRLRAHGNPYTSSQQDPFHNYRLELGYFGISHRQAVISQSSAARHQHLLKQFYSALEATRTSLHIINTGVQHSAHGINAWLVSGAALESRAHPFFHINPEFGDSFADRMDFIGNPQPERDWAIHPFEYKNQTGKIISTELAFTFADYALLVPRIRHHFRLVPIDYDSDYLTPVDTYLYDCTNKEDCKRVPFIWATNNKGELHKLVVSRALIFACKDRLNYWHSLQEMAGVQNKYVDKAIQETSEKLEAEAETERKRLEAEHSEQLEQIRKQTASEVMQRLANVLLNLDLTTTATTLTPAIKSTTPKQEKPEEKIEEKPEETESCEEAWINSPLCTSCNDCIKINSLLFLYNEDKQAYIGDINSGTYAQLVEAAELCPSHCIHPGKPVNPNEPGLDELIKRAEPFNNY
jgi:ferredoxin